MSLRCGRTGVDSVCCVRWCYGDTKQVCLVGSNEAKKNYCRYSTAASVQDKQNNNGCRSMPFVLWCFFFFWLLLCNVCTVAPGFPLIPTWACNFFFQTWEGCFISQTCKVISPEERRIRDEVVVVGGREGEEREREKMMLLWKSVWNFFWGCVVVVIIVVICRWRENELFTN